MPEFSYGHCNAFASNFGVPIDCREHVSGTVVEGQFQPGFLCYGIPIGTPAYVRHQLSLKVQQVAKEVSR